MHLQSRMLLAVCMILIAVAPMLAQARPLASPTQVQEVYQRLLPQIEQIPIFDHHAHPGFPDDADVDAMAAPPGSSPLRERDSNPELVAAAKALFKYPYVDLSPEHAKWLVNRKAELKKEKGIAYFSDILDTLHIEQSVANRAMMADYLDPKRFVWVFFADSFLWPFDNQKERSRNVDEQVYIPLQEKMLHRWMQQEKMAQLPTAFDDYLKFVTQVLEDNQKDKAAIAMKFEVAYFRPTKFADPTRERAEEIYKRYAAGGVPSEQEYRTFQDYIFRYLVREGGRLHLPVHIHSAVGIGDYFSISEGNVMNLENILRDPRYADTVFVLIHGGYPLEREAIWLASVKNVYMDSSLMEVVMYPTAFKESLKQWLETFPDKITFGTDSFPYNDALGAEESYWLGVQTGRMGLAAALAEMVATNEVSEAKALEMAHGFLHDNAVRIYGGKVH
jgi:uncharacterized protein